MKEHVSIKQYDPQYEVQVIELIVSIQQQEYNVPITLKDQPDLLAIQNIYHFFAEDPSLKERSE